MPGPSLPRHAILIAVTALLLAIPALGVHVWMATTFPSFAYDGFLQSVLFSLAWCALLVLIVRWRVLSFASLPAAWLLYLAWLFLVFGEGVSYSLQADTFNARFFAHLSLGNLSTGLRAFPLMIGGGLLLFAIMAVACVWLLSRIARLPGPGTHIGKKALALSALALLVCGLGSAPRRLALYLTRFEQSAHFADTPQGRAVARELDLHPTSRARLMAAPGKNLVIIYMESLERQFWDPRIYPGLTPNLTRLRQRGLDFSGFETFSGANYTMAGLFSSQCGVPLFSSPFAGLDEVAGNNTDRITFHPKVACLGDVLHKAGYRQVYLGGAPSEFSNKGLFFRLHGYDEALGLKELEKEADGKLPESGWGLYDSELFRIALGRYRELETAGGPFNLSMLTLDTHPPHGRPSPGCPKYALNANQMLQAVHCTDYLVGKFVEALSREPDWRNTVIMIMSDHLAMRNDAEPLYPKNYHRQPALLILNAGQGKRPVRMYHMDIAPTLLSLMGVRSNATFIAGQDRAVPDAESSALVDNQVTDAVLRKALWSRVSEFRLCKKAMLVSWTRNDEFDIGGRELAMTYRGNPTVGIHSGQLLDFFIDNANAKLVIADADQQGTLLAQRGDASILTIRLLEPQERKSGLFSVDWLGRKGAIAHVADVPRLRGLTIISPDCASLLRQADAAAKGTKLDFSRHFTATTAAYSTPPPPPDKVAFTGVAAWQFERGLGWLWPEGWGSYAIGDEAALAFHLGQDQCHGALLHMLVDPYLPPSRPELDAQVWVNGSLADTWHFEAPKSVGAAGVASDDHGLLQVAAPIAVSGGKCDARVELRFSRPGARPASYPASEDPRDLQLRVVSLWIAPESAAYGSKH